MESARFPSFKRVKSEKNTWQLNGGVRGRRGRRSRALASAGGVERAEQATKGTKAHPNSGVVVHPPHGENMHRFRWRRMVA